MSRDFKALCGCEIHIIKWSSKTQMASVKNCPLHKAAKDMHEMLKVVIAGYDYNPGSSDLDVEQPIYIGMSLGQYRRIRNLIHEAGRAALNPIGAAQSERERRDAKTNKRLPTIEEMRGAVKGMTNGKPLKQYLEDIADEDEDLEHAAGCDEREE